MAKQQITKGLMTYLYWLEALSLPIGSTMIFPSYTFWTATRSFFVIRHKDNLAFEIVKELELPEKRHQHLLKGEVIKLTGIKTKEKHLKTLRHRSMGSKQWVP